LITVATGQSTPWIANFNPFAPNAQDPTYGSIYENLMFFDTVQAGNVQPWLATGYTWSNGGRSITFTLRHNVKWNDGKPFTSADVAYTFDLEKTSAALNQYGLPLASTATSGPYSVTINFTKPVYTDLYYIAGKSDMLPQHIWSTIPNPTTWLDSHPVGTGSYMVSKVTPQVTDLVANPHYYIPGLPKIKTIRYLTYSGNDTMDAAVQAGQVDWSGGFISNINQTYLARDPKYKLVNIPLAVDFLIPNMKSGPTASLAVRQAMSAAIDRNFISQTVYNGYAPPTNPEGLLTPNFKSVQDPSLASDAFAGGASPAQSKSILQAAGYHLGSNGIFSDPSGKPLNISIKVVSGYTDYISILQILQGELKAAGIGMTAVQEAYSVWSADQDTGNFQMLISNAGYTPSPYAYYYSLIASAVTRPIGTSESIGNYGRYINPTVDSLLSTIAATTDPAAQNQAFYQIEHIFKQDMPDIPLMEAQDEIEFNTHHVTGYPTLSNPYAAPAIWLSPDNGWVMARLAPASG
jgi:peptide/nickel transport system substrate-binding protein